MGISISSWICLCVYWVFVWPNEWTHVQTIWQDITLNLVFQFFFLMLSLYRFAPEYGAVTKSCKNFWTVLLSRSHSSSLFYTHTCLYIVLSLNCVFNFYAGAASICDNSLSKLFCGLMMMLQTLMPPFKYRCFIFTNERKKIDLRWITGMKVKPCQVVETPQKDEASFRPAPSL